MPVADPGLPVRLYTRAVARRKRRSLGVLFGLIAVGFAGLAAWSGSASQWVVLAASAALALWMGELAVRALR